MKTLLCAFVGFESDQSICEYDGGCPTVSPKVIKQSLQSIISKSWILFTGVATISVQSGTPNTLHPGNNKKRASAHNSVPSMKKECSDHESSCASFLRHVRCCCCTPSRFFTLGRTATALVKFLLFYEACTQLALLRPSHKRRPTNGGISWTRPKYLIDVSLPWEQLSFVTLPSLFFIYSLSSSRCITTHVAPAIWSHHREVNWRNDWMYVKLAKC